MPDEKQMNAIRIFCSKDCKDHGKKRTLSGGLHDHDWADLVNQVHYFDKGSASKDIEFLKRVAAPLRQPYPNGPDWIKLVNAPGAHDNILEIIRAGIERELDKPKPPDLSGWE